MALVRIRGDYDVLALEELALKDRFALEQACRAQVQPIYIGDHTALCRILGRYKFYVDTRDQGFGSNVLLDGFWEMWLTIAIARLLKPGMIALDIGANFGYFSLLMADLVGPEGVLIAVEPNPHVVPKLRASLALNGFAARCRVVQAAAAADDDGSALLYATLSEPKNAMVVSPEITADPAVATITEVPKWTLASVARDVGRIDFIKIDAEGAEETIISGLRPFLMAYKPDLVLEFNAARYADAQAFLANVASCYKDSNHTNGNTIRLVETDGSLTPIAVQTILTDKVGEDRLLLFSASVAPKPAQP
jgi:FkbM family methyltransferase